MLTVLYWQDCRVVICPDVNMLLFPLGDVFLKILQICGFPREMDGGSDSTVHYVALIKARFVAESPKRNCFKWNRSVLHGCVRSTSLSGQQIRPQVQPNPVEKGSSAIFGQRSKHSLGICPFKCVLWFSFFATLSCLGHLNISQKVRNHK